MSVDAASERDALRRALRARRRALTAAQRDAAQARLIRTLESLPAYRRARHVAVYLAMDGEVDLSALHAGARRRGVMLYAPVLVGDQLAFRVFDAAGTLARNRYGIPEPSDGAAIDARSLDLVLTPLVGFDRKGARLGMGKGYYDRTFRFLRLRKVWRKPKLLGVAFAFQEIPNIATASWDVSLWGVVTDAGVQRPQTEST